MALGERRVLDRIVVDEGRLDEFLLNKAFKEGNKELPLALGLSGSSSWCLCASVRSSSTEWVKISILVTSKTESAIESFFHGGLKSSVMSPKSILYLPWKAEDYG